MGASRTVKISIINDFVCMNCCVGQHELLAAITQCTDTLKLPLSFEIEHLPFQLINKAHLDDDMPKVDRASFLKARIGEEKFQAFHTLISKWAEEKGIPISFHGVMSPSMRAHRMSQKALRIGGEKLQTTILCAIFKAHIEDGMDIADPNILAEVAEKEGLMSRVEALKFLDTDELEKEVNELCHNVRSKGITGVPMTIIDGKWAISGAQSSEVFIQIFKKLAAAGPSKSPSPFSDPVTTAVGRS